MAGQDPVCPLKDMAGAAPCSKSKADCGGQHSIRCCSCCVGLFTDASAEMFKPLLLLGLLLELEGEQLAVDSFWRALARLQAA